MNPELTRTLSLRFSYLGEAELQLAYLKAEEKTEQAVAAEIEAWRKPFERGKTADMGSASFATAENWREISKASDKAARAELLKNSSALAELNELEQKAEELRRQADAKNAEVTRLWNELNSLPDRADAINLQLVAINNELVNLDAAKLREDFKQQLRAILNGATADPFGQVQLAALIVTADLRTEVLSEEAGELEKELSDLKARSKVLAKKLGQTSTL